MKLKILRERIVLDWGGSEEEPLLEAVVDKFEEFPQHYTDGYISVETIKNILTGIVEDGTHENELNIYSMRILDYLASEEVGVLELHYTLFHDEETRSLSKQELVEALQVGCIINEHGYPIEDFQRHVVVTFGLKQESLNGN